MRPGFGAVVPGHHHQLQQRCVAHAQQAQVAVFPAFEKTVDLRVTGIFPTAPDAGQRSTGDAHAEDVEQLPGQLEHFRRQVVEAVVQARQGLVDGGGHFLGGDGAFEHHRDQCLQKRQVVGLQHGKTTGRMAGRAAAEAGDKPGAAEKGTGAEADFQDAATAQYGRFRQAWHSCYSPGQWNINERRVSGSVSGSICRKADRSAVPR